MDIDSPDTEVYSADDCTNMWQFTIDDKWKDASLKYMSVDINEAGEFKDLKKELVDPYFTGPPERAIPCVFVLMKNTAYVVTGPSPMDDVMDLTKELHDEAKVQSSS